MRGKVAAFLAADSSTPPEKAARKAEEAQSLFTLARAYAEARPGAPPVIAVGGVIGSGKSTLAEALGRALGVPVVSSDRVRKALAGVRATERRRRAPTRRRSRRGRSTKCSGGPGWCWAPGAVSCSTRRSASGTLRLRARDLARRHGRRFLFVETVCDEATLRERLRRRAAGPSISDAGEALLERVRAEFEPVTELGAGEHVRVDTTGPPEAAVRAAREALRPDVSGWAGRRGPGLGRRVLPLSEGMRDEHEASRPDR